MLYVLHEGSRSTRRAARSGHVLSFVEKRLASQSLAGYDSVDQRSSGFARFLPRPDINDVYQVRRIDMRHLILLAVTLGLSGCESVEIEYAKPSSGGDFASAESQSNEHYEYVAFPKAFILVRPVEGDAANKAGETETARKTVGNASDMAKPARANGGNSAPSPASATGKKTGGGSAGEKGAAAAASAPAKGASAPGNAKDDPGATPPPTLSDSLATAVIDGKKWEAKLVLMPDDTRTFVVKGVSGFWKSTTIGITRYQNSDMASSVSSTAENLVPKRIGQVASIIATAVQIGAVLGVSGEVIKPIPLQSFIVEVPAQGQMSDTINDDWTFKFAYDAEGMPAGTVSYKDFSEKAMNRKVAYWPTPACRSATLTIGRTSDSTRAAFHLIVSSPDVIRLQPLPAKGKVDFGSVCGATASGTASVDAVASLSDDLLAVQQAIKTIKDAKSAGDSASAPKAGGAAASSPKK
jgi:hypothetical protein